MLATNARLRITRCRMIQLRNRFALLSSSGGSVPHMYAPIDGLRVLAVETSLLIAFTILAFLFLKFFRSSFSYPRWLQVVLARNSRAVVLVIGVALIGRALLLPWVGIPQPRIDDEYSHLLAADTFSHFRLTNPTPRPGSTSKHFR